MSHESPDWTVTDSGPYHVSTRDENAVQAAAEQVAYTHFSGVTPEFAEWFAEQDYHTNLAYVVSNLIYGDAADLSEARRLCVLIQEDFTQWVAACADTDCWPLARQMYREVRKA